MSECLFCEKLLTDDNLCIVEQELTKTVVNHNFSVPGRVMVILKDHVENEAKLSPKKQKQFFAEALRVGSTLKKYYNAERMNYMLLGNEIPHIHWHVIPRSKESIAKNFFPKEMFNQDIVSIEKQVELTNNIKKEVENSAW